MRLMSLSRFAPALVLGLGLAAAPLALSFQGLGDQPAFAKNGGNGGGGGKGGGGKGNGKGNGGHGSGGSGHGNAGKSAGQGGGVGNAAAGATADAGPPGKHLGHAEKTTSSVASLDDDASDSGLHPSSLGRLNGFMNASPNALANAAPNSAVGVVAHAYRDALSDYADALAAGEDPAAIDAALQSAAAAIALAANKEVTPDVVAAVNAHLAETYPEDPALAGFADPQSPESAEAADAIAARAEDDQSHEINQGLGSGAPITRGFIADNR